MEWRIMTVNERTDSTKNADTDWKIKEYAQSIEESSTKSKVQHFSWTFHCKQTQGHSPRRALDVRHTSAYEVRKSGNGHLIILSLNLRGFGQR